MIEGFSTIDPSQHQRPERSTAREPKRSLAFEDVLGARPEAGDAAEQSRDELELVLVDRDGTGQSISLPWRLAANDALSQLFARLDAEEAGAMQGTAMTATLQKLGNIASATTIPMGHGSASLDTSMPSSLAWTCPPQTASQQALARKEQSGTTRPLPGSAEPWQARLLRWLEGHDQQLTVRLRDFRLDERGQERLVTSLFAFAREHGLRLQRIVVNAREVWRSPF